VRDNKKTPLGAIVLFFLVGFLPTAVLMQELFWQETFRKFHIEKTLESVPYEKIEKVQVAGSMLL
jgi:hypothetical protein